MGFKNSEQIIPRQETRRQRYDRKITSAKILPMSLATVHFIHDGNLGYILRAAACFGCKTVYCLGAIPPRKELMPTSGSLVDYVKIVQFPNTNAFLEHVRGQNIKLVAAELCDGAISLYDYKFDFNRETCIMLGNEEIGVPGEILHHAEKIYIPMPGVGAVLNTAQAGNIMAYEYVRQMSETQWKNG